MVTLCALWPMSPMNISYPVNRDAGVFLYVGWRILNGELPYRDVWDHKPPMIFYINALGLAIADRSRWGIWLIEFISLLFATFFGYKVVQKAFGPIPAVFSTFLWSLTLIPLAQGGNLTTEYTLPFQFAALALAISALEKSDPRPLHWFLLGVTGAIAFFTKQTTIGIWLSILPLLIVKRFKAQKLKELVFDLSYFSGGAIIVCLGWIAFFGLQGSLTEFWNAAFEYNFVYTSLVNDFSNRIKPVTEGIAPLAAVGLLQFAGIGYVIGLLLIFVRKDVVHNWQPLLLIGLLDLPIELILVSISGRKYAHYYMTMLPILAIFTGLTFWAIFSSRFIHDFPHTTKHVLTAGILGVLLWTSFPFYVGWIKSYKGAGESPKAIITVIEQETNPGDEILLWGAEASVNYFLRRKSPTRFVYQYPLYTKGYVSEQMILEFLDDLIRKRPPLIVDTRNPQTPLYKFPIQTNAIQQRIAQLQCLYRNVGEIEVLISGQTRNWSVYKYTAANCFP